MKYMPVENELKQTLAPQRPVLDVPKKKESPQQDGTTSDRMGFQVTIRYLFLKSVVYLLIYLVTAILACGLYSSRPLWEAVQATVSYAGFEYWCVSLLIGGLAFFPVLLLLSILHAWRVLPDVLMLISYAVLLYMLHSGESGPVVEKLTTLGWLVFAVVSIACVPVCAFIVRWWERWVAGIRIARMGAREDLRASLKCMVIISIIVLLSASGFYHLQGYDYTNFDDRVDFNAGRFESDTPEFIAKDWLLAASQGRDILDKKLDERYEKDAGSDSKDKKTWREMDGSIFAHPGGKKYRLIRVENVETQAEFLYKGDDERRLKRYVRMDVTYEDLSIPEAQREPQTDRIVGIRTRDLKHDRWSVCPYGIIATTGVTDQSESASYDHIRLMFAKTFDNEPLAFIKLYIPERNKQSAVMFSYDGGGPIVQFDMNYLGGPGRQWTNYATGSDSVILRYGDPIRFALHIPGAYTYIDGFAIEGTYPMNDDETLRSTNSSASPHPIKTTKAEFTNRETTQGSNGMHGL